MKAAHLLGSAIIAAVLLAATAASAAGAGSFVGTYTNDELTINFLANERNYTGSVRLRDQTFPLSGTEKPGALEGAFTSGSRTNEPSGAPNQGAAWRAYRHPTGLSMLYPPDWQLKEHPQMLQLIPPDAASNADGPTEAYLVFAEAAEEVTSAEDPRVLQFLEGQLQQLMPFLKRAGKLEKIRAGAAPGVLATWEGTNPKGMTVCAHACATILRGYGVALVGLGDKSQVAAREKTLRGIFASFAAGEGQKDPQLVGTWKYWHYSTSALGGFSTETTRFLMLRADGTCRWSNRSESGGSARGTDSLGNESWRAGVAGASSDSDRGTWSAGSGKLYVMWQNGSLSEWSYNLAGQPGQRRLLLKGSEQQKPDEWTEEPQ